MPDRDWYHVNVRRNWRGVARSIEAGEDFARVGDLALRAMGRTIREAGGIDGFAEMTEIVESFCAGTTIPETFARLREVSIFAGGSELTRLAKVAAESAVVAADRGQFKASASVEVAQRFIERAFECFLFAPTRMRCVGSRFASPQEAHEWQQKGIKSMKPRLETLAKRIVEHPAGTGLRAPARVVPRVTTSELLYQPIGFAANA